MARRRKRGPDEGRLNLFGEWLNTLAAILHTDYGEIVAHTNEPRMNVSTLSRITRRRTRPPEGNVQRVWDALYRIAQIRDEDMGSRQHPYTAFLNIMTRSAFYNAGSEVTEDQRELSEVRLRGTQVMLDLLQDIDEKDQIIALLEEQIKQLSQDVKRLRP